MSLLVLLGNSIITSSTLLFHMVWSCSWGTASQSRLQTVKRKQNKCIWSIFFAFQRETASIYYKLLEIHTLDNVFNIRMPSFIYKREHFPGNTPGVLQYPHPEFIAITLDMPQEGTYTDQCPKPTTPRFFANRLLTCCMWVSHFKVSSIKTPKYLISLLCWISQAVTLIDTFFLGDAIIIIYRFSQA